jgi:hypothetical protein
MPPEIGRYGAAPSLRGTFPAAFGATAARDAPPLLPLALPLAQQGVFSTQRVQLRSKHHSKSFVIHRPIH